MIGRIASASVAAVFAIGFLGAPALAGHCPKDVKKITEAMSTMDDRKMSMAKTAAAEGLALHKDGKHGDSLKVLHEAMKALDIKH